MQRCRDRLYVKAKRTRSPKYWNLFKQYRQTAKEEIRASHKVYVQDMVGATTAEKTHVLLVIHNVPP